MNERTELFAGEPANQYTRFRTAGALWFLLGALLAGTLAWHAVRAYREAGQLEAQLRGLQQEIHRLRDENMRRAYDLETMEELDAPAPDRVR